MRRGVGHHELCPFKRGRAERFLTQSLAVNLAETHSAAYDLVFDRRLGFDNQSILADGHLGIPGGVEEVAFWGRYLAYGVAPIGQLVGGRGCVTVDICHKVDARDGLSWCIPHARDNHGVRGFVRDLEVRSCQ